MSEWLRACVTPEEHPGLVLSTYMKAYNYLVTLVPGDPIPSYGLCR